MPLKMEVLVLVQVQSLLLLSCSRLSSLAQTAATRQEVAVRVSESRQCLAK